VDAIMVGRETAKRDDPRLTARPPGPRTAIRVVLDSQGSLSSDSRLVRSAREVPVLVAVGESAPAAARQRLAQAGCELFISNGASAAARLDDVLAEFARRRLTNVLVEGGSRLLGSLLDARQIDEVHVFIAPKLVGGESAPAALGGAGIAQLSAALELESPSVERLGEDAYIHARVRR
jgi:diaminohydroxyphosphoribosylaminopyrimidine deaminase/5-amino-6-(5-phosphoribosylamino)uracil reductase